MAPVQFGNYQILRKIGAGGMAQVFEAQRMGLEGFSRRVALKCILPEMTRDHRFVEMFVNEARLGSQLHHPNIIEIQDFNKVNEIYYIAMEMVDGVDLGEVISRFRERERTFPPGLVIDVMLQVLDGLGYAHEAKTETGEVMGIIHRDVKPSNLLLTSRGTVKIADFGIAKAATNAFQTKTAEVTKGSLAYMAPEQITREAPVSPASDLFSLGAVLFEMLSLRALFDGENMPSIMFKVAQVEIERDLTDLQTHSPRFLPILEKALAKDLSVRYQNAAEMAVDMRALRPEFPTELTIQELAAEFIKEAPSSDEDDWVGEQTASMLGFTLGGSTGAGMSHLAGYATSHPNLAGYATSHPGFAGPLGAGSHPGIGTQTPPVGSNPLLNSTLYLPSRSGSSPQVPGYLEDSQVSITGASPAAGTPASRLPWKAIAGLIGLAGVGAFAWFGLTPAPSILVVASSPPGAQVRIDGQMQTRIEHGQPVHVLTPARISLPESGAAVISLEREGFEPFSTRLTYHRGESAELAPTLKPLVLVGSLEVSSIPSGASIEPNGKRIDPRPPARLEDLPAGARYEIKLMLDGYAPTSGSVEIRQNAMERFAVTLFAPPPGVGGAGSRPAAAASRPSSGAPPARTQTAVASGSATKGATSAPKQPAGPPGTLVVSSVPPDCVVYIDGSRRGNAPVSVQLSPGAHRVRLEQFDGTTAKEFTVQVASQQEVTRVWDLDSKQFISD